MNKLNIEYVVMFGRSGDYADLHYRATPDSQKFDHIADARRYAKGYKYARIFKFKFFHDSGDLEYYTEIY